jgi:hypothetical protein
MTKVTFPKERYIVFNGDIEIEVDISKEEYKRIEDMMYSGKYKVPCIKLTLNNDKLGGYAFTNFSITEY